ncbi:Hypothetical protein, putative, partial [Bodo saltans]
MKARGQLVAKRQEHVRGESCDAPVVNKGDGRKESNTSSMVSCFCLNCCCCFHLSIVTLGKVVHHVSKRDNMFRRCNMARCLHKAMVGIDQKMWSSAPRPTIALRTVGATSAVINDVGELIALCEQARGGVNGKTVMDRSACKTLRVAADRVSVVWPAMSHAVTDCAAHLGLGAGVTAQLHDVLVYQPGDFFKRHVDSIKHPRHCATMVVDTGLAVGRCVGGVLHVGDKPWVSCGSGSYAAWHTNAEHHVTELEAGHRVVAMYNLLRSELVVLPKVVQVEPALSGATQAAPEVPVVPAELTLHRANKNEVAALMKHLEDNAAAYASKFTEADLSKADDLFVKYAKRRGQGPTYIKLSNAPVKPSSERWRRSNLRKDGPSRKEPMDAIKDPAQEFVGFWLMRQYPSREGIVRRAKLSGSDADLVEAVSREFGVPLAHIQCRVVYNYDGGSYPRNSSERRWTASWGISADRVEGLDDDPRDEYRLVAPREKDEEGGQEGEREVNQEAGSSPIREGEVKQRERGKRMSIRGLRSGDGYRDNSTYDILYGQECCRVAIVGGLRQRDKEFVGESTHHTTYNGDVIVPNYRYQDTYLYFHV